MNRKPQRIDLKKLYDHPHNPRKHINVDELIESIKDVGQLSPLLVRLWGDGYQIISGHRRKAAIAKLGLVDVDCDVIELDDEQAYKALMVANIQSASLSEIEEAEGIRQMIEQFGWTQERVSKEFGKSQNWVNMRLGLLQLNKPIQDQIIARAINPSNARHIAQAPKEMQEAIADKVIREDLSSRDTEKLVKVLKDDTISADLKKLAVSSTYIKPDAITAASKITDPEVLEKVTDKMQRNQITSTEIHRISLNTEIKQSTKDHRERIFAKHEAEGTVPPIPTDEELAARKRSDKLEGFFINLREANRLVQPPPEIIDYMFEFSRSREATDHLIFILGQIQSFAQKIEAERKIRAKSSRKNRTANGNVIEMKKI